MREGERESGRRSDASKVNGFSLPMYPSRLRLEKRGHSTDAYEY